MEHRRLPGSGLDVSVICLGTMLFGRPVAEADAIRLTHAAIDLGVNFFDTADIYEGYDRVMGSAGGVSEAILGKALEGRRDRAIITTKVGNPIGDGGYTGKGLNRTHILRQIDRSLSQLRTTYVDLYELHRPDPATPLAESIAAMAELIRLGKVRHWGFSNFDVAQIEEMISLCETNGWPKPAVSQPCYNWLKRDIESAHLPACIRHGIGVTPYQPLQAGLLTGRYRRGQPPPSNSRGGEHAAWLVAPGEAMFDKLDAFEREATAAHLSPAKYAIRWVLDHPGVSSVVVGAKDATQLRDIVES